MDSSRGVYAIAVAAELVGVGEQTLRLYEKKGLLTPQRTAGGTRRYSADDVATALRIVALISDLYENPDDLLDALSPYRVMGNDLIVFHILDPAEIEFPYKTASRFQDLESGEEVPVIPEVFAEQYRKMMQEHIQALTSKFSEVRIDYVLCNTSKPLDEALFSYLGNRERLMRVR